MHKCVFIFMILKQEEKKGPILRGWGRSEARSPRVGAARVWGRGQPSSPDGMDGSPEKAGHSPQAPPGSHSANPPRPCLPVNWRKNTTGNLSCFTDLLMVFEFRALQAKLDYTKPTKISQCCQDSKIFTEC